MNTITELLLYILLGVFFYIYDISTYKYDQNCTDTISKKINFNLNLLFHHIVSTSFWHFAWLSTNKNILLLYVILGPIIVIHWRIFGDCIFTVKARENCKEYYFPMHQIHEAIVPKIIYPYFHMTYMYIVGFIKFIILYKYNDPSILSKINIIIISFITSIYLYKKNKDISII